MSATIQIHGFMAVVSDGVWLCNHEGLQQALQLTVDDVGAHEPNRDLVHAQRAVQAMSGRVIRYDESPFVPGRVY